MVREAQIVDRRDLGWVGAPGQSAQYIGQGRQGAGDGFTTHEESFCTHSVLIARRIVICYLAQTVGDEQAKAQHHEQTAKEQHDAN